MYGIDISNWQADLNIADIASSIDFAICKATEGLGYVDPTCDNFIEQLKQQDKLWGFYHFARGNSPEEEASFFYENCKNYFGYGIPVLDYETNENSSPSEWVERFCKAIHSLTGVFPIVYVSASYISAVASEYTCSNCGLWVAGYPANYPSFNDYDLPYSISPWEFAAIWQFTSSLQLPGYSGALDGNIAYMDRKGWLAYANASGASNNDSSHNSSSSTDNSNNSVTSEQAIRKMAIDVIAGLYGNGEARKENLYKAIQTEVNSILGG